MKKFKILLIVLLVIIMIPLGINFFIIYKTKNNINEVDEVKEKYDIALVLGCSVLKNNQPSKMLKDRLDMGIELYNKNKVSKILISGDHKDTYSEVEVMHKYLLDHNINEDDILIDYEGYSTSESLINYKENYKNKKVLIVTQKYHLYRALYISSKLDLNATGINAVEINYQGQIFREIREILARNKDYFMFFSQ